MNASTETKKAEELSLTQTAAALLRHYLGGRRGLILLTVIALGAGLVLNWSWLVAIGVAPLILALLPCVAMCALGLCANKMMGNKSCSGSEVPQKSAGTPDVSAAETPRISAVDPGSTDDARPYRDARGENAKA